MKGFPYGLKLGVLAMASALPFVEARAQLSTVAESHVAGNVPAPQDFRRFLLRDLTAEFRRRYGDGIAADYELLREGATQMGVASPKFYLWAKITRSGKLIVEGATRVAAVEKKEFEILQFISSEEIFARPDAVARAFPQALLTTIRERARSR